MNRSHDDTVPTVPTRRQFIAAAAAVAAVPWDAASLAAQADPGLAKAMEGVRAGIPLAAKDSERPVFHFGPPAQWNNDPNGTLFYKGWHHLFYQLNPYGTTGTNQHWGHARSRDLVNWEHLPIAISPSLDKGERYIYSGGAILAADGRPRILYTSIGHPDPQQWLAIPEDDDLVRWTKFSGNPVLAIWRWRRNSNRSAVLSKRFRTSRCRVACNCSTACAAMPWRSRRSSPSTASPHSDSSCGH